jgi:hypothetical protein
MKFEKMSESKFKSFEGFELKNPLKVVGGGTVRTTYDQYKVENGNYILIHSGTDTWTTGPDAGSTSISEHWGESGDMVKVSSLEVPSEFIYKLA